MQKSVPPFGLRLPAELKACLKEQAQANRRSMNSEVIAILERALTSQRGVA